MVEYERIKKKFTCECGKVHNALIDVYIAQENAIDSLSSILGTYNCKKPFIVADKNTFSACGEKVLLNIKENGLSNSLFIFEEEKVKPAE